MATLGVIGPEPVLSIHADNISISTITHPVATLGSTITGKPLPDFNDTLVKCVETSMKALVMKSKYIAQYH